MKHTLKTSISAIRILLVITAILTIPAMTLWALASQTTTSLVAAISVGIVTTMAFYVVMIPTSYLITASEQRYRKRRTQRHEQQCEDIKNQPLSV